MTEALTRHCVICGATFAPSAKHRRTAQCCSPRCCGKLGGRTTVERKRKVKEAVR